MVDVLALRYGHDSRSGERELPLGTDPVVRIPRPTGRRVRSWLAAVRVGEHERRRRPAPLTRKPFWPYVPRDMYCHRRFDLVAVGK